MSAVTVKKIVDNFRKLPLDEKEYTVDIMKKQLIETKRDLLGKNSKSVIQNYKIGRIKKGKAKDLFKDLENDSQTFWKIKRIMGI